MGLFSHRSRKGSSIFLGLSLLTLTLFMSRGYSQSACINQSPRDLTLNRQGTGEPVMGLDYNYQSTVPVVNLPVPDDLQTVRYQGQTLHICDRHYHLPVENLQSCDNGKKIPTSKKVPASKKDPLPGDWIEFHAVYAYQVDTTSEGCRTSGPDNNLRCCTAPPFVVRGFSAEVVAEAPVGPPVRQPDQGLLVEWIGSNTSPDEPPDTCKYTPAQWSFRLGCGFTVGLNQLEGMKPHDARPVQPPQHNSPDLTLVGTPPPPTTACRAVQTAPIPNTNPQMACQAACRAPLNRFSGEWHNVPSTGTPQYGLCVCCPLPRPQ
jgi:hypothetical protein